MQVVFKTWSETQVTKAFRSPAPVAGLFSLSFLTMYRLRRGGKPAACRAFFSADQRRRQWSPSAVNKNWNLPFGSVLLASFHLSCHERTGCARRRMKARAAAFACLLLVVQVDRCAVDLDAVVIAPC